MKMDHGVLMEDPKSYIPDLFVVCIDCDNFVECPCGCRFGYCVKDPDYGLHYGPKGGCMISEGAVRR